MLAAPNRGSLALVLLSTSALFSFPGRAAEPQAKLERLPASPLLLQPPQGLSGDFAIAREAPEIDFAIFPGQWEGAKLWSSWGDSLFAADGKFYASLGDHDAPHGTAYVHAIDVEKQTVTQVVDYNQVVKREKDQYTPGKIHGPLVEGGDGWIYFLGYRGNVRQTTATADYQGDWLLRYSPSTGRSENLGIPVAHSSTPVLLAHPASKSLYGLSVPGLTMPGQETQFFRYSLEKNELIIRQPIATQGPRAMILAANGRAYFGVQDEGAERDVLMRYDPQTNAASKLEAAIPGDGTLRAATSPNAEGVAYCFSKDGAVFSFDTRTEQSLPLTQAFVAGRQYIASCRLDPTGRFVYYIPGAHGGSSEVGTPLIQLDVRTKQRKVIAFLNEHVRQARDYNLGGTYGIALNADGSQVFVNFNGARLTGARRGKVEFGLCAALVVHIPAGERR
jgi:hypothetical protein